MEAAVGVVAFIISAADVVEVDEAGSAPAWIPVVGGCKNAHHAGPVTKHAIVPLIQQVLLCDRAGQGCPWLHLKDQRVSMML